MGECSDHRHHPINAEKVKLSVFAGLFASVQRMSLVLCDSQAQLLRDLRSLPFSLAFVGPLCVCRIFLLLLFSLLKLIN